MSPATVNVFGVRFKYDVPIPTKAFPPLPDIFITEPATEEPDAITNGSL